MKLTLPKRQHFQAVISEFRKHRRNPMAAIGVFRVRCQQCLNLFKSASRQLHLCTECRIPARSTGFTPV